MAFADYKATTDDYVLFVDNQELLESTNPDDVNATTPNLTRLQFNLDLAYNDCYSFYATTCPTGKARLTLALKKLMLVMTRHMLDTVSRRTDVEADYDKAIEFIEECNTPDVCNTPIDELVAEELSLTVITSLVRAEPRVWRRENFNGYLSKTFGNEPRTRRP